MIKRKQRKGQVGLGVHQRVLAPYSETLTLVFCTCMRSVRTRLPINAFLTGF
jgi:hypothetical protein